MVKGSRKRRKVETYGTNGERDLLSFTQCASDTICTIGGNYDCASGREPGERRTDVVVEDVRSAVICPPTIRALIIDEP